ncbi:MAG: histidine--tRNA ligase [Bacteroidetes bacterium]|nr:histidine--tRNA ligase [Bacteroidota bacterium]
MNKISIPQGTRDFVNETIYKRDFIFKTIKRSFELHGFEPLETPAMENLETLMGKYGDEGDQLIFKILNNGLDNPTKREKAKTDFEQILAGKNSAGITERALRYDLTIPFARFVAMNYGQLNFPFKRYQMQPVWRADRPQRGRYREFYQCDADIVGSTSLLNEVELMEVYTEVFQNLKVNVEICVNHRKLLSALANHCNLSNQLQDITMSIDKLDKIGLEKVMDSLRNKQIPEENLKLIEKFLTIEGSNSEKLKQLENLLGSGEDGKKALDDLNNLLAMLPSSTPIKIDPSLARGLNYYTGAIFEVKALDVNIGSIGGGGRYDNLTGLFGVPHVPGIGISFGVDRIFDVMESLSLFPDEMKKGVQVLFFHTGDAECKSILPTMQWLRQADISCELYHEKAKFDKQFKYAEKKHIPFIAIMGSKEIEESSCVIKHLASGKQESVLQKEIMNFFKQHITA